MSQKPIISCSNFSSVNVRILDWTIKISSFIRLESLGRHLGALQFMHQGPTKYEQITNELGKKLSQK